jgi:CIC family chloride channel protein
MPATDDDPTPAPAEPPAPGQRDAAPPAAPIRAVLAQRKSAFARALRRLRIVGRLRKLYWLRAKLFLAPSEAQRLFVLTAVIGALCGLAAVSFHLLIQLLESSLIERALSAPGDSWMAWTIVTPILGGLAAGLLLQFVFPRSRGSGIPEVKATFAQRGSDLGVRDSLGKFGVGALQIGSGASLGREGPTVHICAGIAGLLGRWARVKPSNRRRLLPVGAAAGIAAAFNAPIAAVTFAIEEIVGNLDKTVLSGVIVAAAIAAAIERSVLGEHPVFDVQDPQGLESATSLVLYVLMGLAAALVSVSFTDALLGLRRRFRALRGIPPWAKPALGCALTGVLAVIALRWLGTRGVTGGGYATLEHALNGELAAHTMLALCALKLVATAFCYGSGGAGGIFAPALFIGGMLGGAFGALDAHLFGHSQAALGSFALVGMGAVLAGSVRAPITSVLIIVEMTDGYGLIVPLMIANMISYGLARRLRPKPIYDALLAQDGVRLRPPAAMQVLEDVPLAEVLRREEAIVVFDLSMRAGDLVRARTKQEVYPVVELPSGRLVGIVTDEELDLLASEPEIEQLVNAQDVMRPPVGLRRGEDLRMALETMLAQGIRRLPVLDDDQRVTGLLDEAAIARVYLRRNTS